MERLILTLVLIGLTHLNINAQYLPLLNEDNKWKIFHNQDDNIIFHYQTDNRYIIGDTIINDLEYKIIGQISFFISINGSEVSDEYIVAFMREDTITGKVFSLLHEMPNYSEEFLSFDQSVEVGDTVKVEFSYNPVVKDIISIITKDGVSRRKYIFENTDENEFFYIEGIGGSNGLHFPFYPNFELTQTLGEFCVNDLRIFPEGGSDECFVYTNLIEVEELSELSIYPNPLYDVINIESGTNDLKKISIADVTGMEVFRSEFKNQIDLSSLDKGMYFLKVFDSGNGTRIIKLLKY